MALKVSDEAIEKTTKCSWNYSCLEDNNSPKCSVNKSMCEVENTLENYLFVDWNHEDCHYKLEFGDSFICRCPVREEIYERYNM